MSAQAHDTQARIAPFDPERIRADFPILATRVNKHPLIYLDSAATTQKPRAVIDSLERYYTENNANVHRGVHTLSQRATQAFEDAREKVRAFINAGSAAEIIFTRGTTDAINLVAQSYARTMLKAGDEILIGEAEHHANIVPWQMLCQHIGCVLKVVPINDAGELELEAVTRAWTPRIKLCAFGHISNALGSINPVREITALAHQAGAKIVIDGAQAVAHGSVNVAALDCDFYAFSGHKLFGPTGIGVLYGKRALLEAMPPYQGGGDMIKVVTFAATEYADLPYKFEAGTPHIAGGIGLGAALDYLDSIDFAGAVAHEHRLLDYATAQAQAVPGLRIIGTARAKAAVLSFTIDGIHPQDLGVILDGHGVAIRTGHHCAMPVMQRFGLAGTARASFAFYNTFDEIDCFFAALAKARRMLA
ncbi:MAG: cysteine desulfurase [Gammaproteobacteria bacterium]|nr:cysteine desulfurase [Gammaproteobacteria bacterium]